MSVCLEPLSESKRVIIPSYFNETQKKIARMMTTSIREGRSDTRNGYPCRDVKMRDVPPWERETYYNSFYYNYYTGIEIFDRLNTLYHLSDTLVYNLTDDRAFQTYFKEYANCSYNSEDYSDFIVPSLNKKFKWIDAKIRPYSSVTDQAMTYWYSSDENGKQGDVVLLRLCGGPDPVKDLTDPVLFHADLTSHSGSFFHPLILGEVYCPHCNSMWEMAHEGIWEPVEQCPGLLPLLSYKAKRGDEGEKGFVVVTGSAEAFCPVCGEGKLE